METYDLIPKGKHSARGSDPQFGFTDGGKPQVSVTFTITDEGEANGREIVWFGYFTEKTEARTLESLRICGWEGDDLTNLGPLDNDVSIVVDHEQYEGKWQAKVRWVNKAGGGNFKMAKPMSPEQLKAFAAEMRGAARASAEGSPKKPAARPASSNGSRGSAGHDERNPPPPTDDIPF
jgi:hypothetical protein